MGQVIAAGRAKEGTSHVLRAHDPRGARAAGGVTGLDRFSLALAFAADVAMYSGGAYRSRQSGAMGA